MRNLILAIISLLALSACSNNLIGASGSAGSHVLNNEQSYLQFISVKNSLIAETHRFHSLSGFVSEGERAQVQVNLASVETGIPIRNERMREHLFKIAQFATANISVELSDHQTKALRVGQQMIRDIGFTVDLHGKTQTLSSKVSITRHVEGGLVIQSISPAIVNTAGFDMTAGVDKLRELAGLAAISQAVPVSFSLQFDAALN
ncbi:MAG: YceI family protein [Pseudomonadales bacterium]